MEYKKGGFTLVELMVVISIISLLSSIIIANLTVARRKAQIAAGQQWEATMYHAIGDQFIAKYDFDDCSGNTAADSSGNRNVASLANTPGWLSAPSTFNNNGCALTFNGSSQYVLTPNLGTPPLDFTVSVWINSTSAGGVVLAELGQAGPNGGWHHSLIEVETNGVVKVCLWVGGQGCVNATSNIIFNQWHLISVTYNATKQNLKGYYDAVEGGNATFNKQSPSSLYFAVGATDSTNSGNGNYFSGSIDNVRIYGNTLTALQINTQYLADRGKYKNFAFK